MFLVAGDFNLPDISWTQDGGFCVNKGRPSSLEFLNTLSKNYLSQHVIEPTFRNNILDLIVTSDSARVFRVAHGPPLGLSENDGLHAPLTWDYELRAGRHSSLNEALCLLLEIMICSEPLSTIAPNSRTKMSMPIMMS